MIIGGEHFILPSQFLKRSTGYIDNIIRVYKNIYDVNFTFGGYYSLLAILEEIKLKFGNHSVVLLPSYLCPSILKPFKVKQIQYKFYRIDQNLFVDKDHLVSILDNNVKAVFFIDYFGKSQARQLQQVVEILKSKNISIIQDIVQCLQINSDQLFGDYIFNSFRKFFPFEGSILLSKEKMNIHYSKTRNRYIVYKRLGQLMRYFHVKFHLFSSKHFLAFLQKAEDRYYINEILRMPKFNIMQLNKYDIEGIVKNQNYYFTLLLNAFGEKVKVPELLNKNNFTPLGFVIKTERRDEIRRFLFQQNIFPPIHWKLPGEIEQNSFEESIKLSSVILTIPLTGLTDEKYQYLFKNLNKLFKNGNIS